MGNEIASPIRKVSGTTDKVPSRHSGLNRGLMAPWIWLVVAGLLLVAEMLTVHLLFASLALAALAAALAGFFGGSLAVQGIAFSIFAVISLAFIRPFALKHLKKQSPAEATNVDALLGQRALVTEMVNQDSGYVKLSGETWSARTESGAIPAGENVIVIAIDGAIARVKRREVN
jgi:membrane protein implicated in regulation of membrane protease activity